jgi:hypothetical protein
MIRRFRTALDTAERITLVMTAEVTDGQGSFLDMLPITLPISDDIHTPVDAAIDLHEKGLRRRGPSAWSRLR